MLTHNLWRRCFLTHLITTCPIADVSEALEPVTHLVWLRTKLMMPARPTCSPSCSERYELAALHTTAASATASGAERQLQPSQRWQDDLCRAPLDLAVLERFLRVPVVSVRSRLPKQRQQPLDIFPKR
ncbi:hypothetical protein BAUCODRAFT_385660 [Baudoinia panamericana UAMH 10762]|uniref:Secreted protein n=1 Tax=Baudoinia panamericana (strain UAMH 10762) TaxID=717646 RepID=M2LW98_BAUPA|nr:uncharacterized protein BAUCODRAFT_385660 [Baudoinia panamericana UAMH 10762]EMC98937.1 hypothetical protein BAUCODRAFT_385660 [Baudoinia panamericana UAMH 10762]